MCTERRRPANGPAGPQRASIDRQMWACPTTSPPAPDEWHGTLLLWATVGAWSGLRSASLQRAKQSQARTGTGAAPLEHLPAPLAQSYSARVFQTSGSGFTTGGQLQKVCTEMPLGHTRCYLWAQRGPLRPSAAWTVPLGAAWMVPAGTAQSRGHQLLPAWEAGTGSHRQTSLNAEEQSRSCDGYREGHHLSRAEEEEGGSPHVPQ